MSYVFMSPYSVSDWCPPFKLSLLSPMNNVGVASMLSSRRYTLSASPGLTIMLPSNVLATRPLIRVVLP